MVRDNNTDEFKGYAYVEFRDEDSYNKALSYNRTVCLYIFTIIVVLPSLSMVTKYA